MRGEGCERALLLAVLKKRDGPGSLASSSNPKEEDREREREARGAAVSSCPWGERERERERKRELNSNKPFTPLESLTICGGPIGRGA